MDHRSFHYWRRAPDTSILTTRPHCVTAKTCDGCHTLFVDSDDLTVPPARYTYPCGHVYCRDCFDSFQKNARENLYEFCRRCGSCVARAFNKPPCLHHVPVRNFRPSDFVPGKKLVFEPAYMLLVGQKTDLQCQRCHLVLRLQELTREIQSKVSLLPFPGEVYACVEINGYIIHGMLKEFQDALVDPVEDTQIPRSAESLDPIAKELVKILDSYPVENNFDPKGTLFFSYRARKHKSWADGLVAEQQGLRMDRIPMPVFAQDGVPWIPMSYDESIPLSKPPKGVPRAPKKLKTGKSETSGSGSSTVGGSDLPLRSASRKRAAPESPMGEFSEKVAGKRRAE